MGKTPANVRLELMVYLLGGGKCEYARDRFFIPGYYTITKEDLKKSKLKQGFDCGIISREYPQLKPSSNPYETDALFSVGFAAATAFLNIVGYMKKIGVSKEDMVRMIVKESKKK